MNETSLVKESEIVTTDRFLAHLISFEEKNIVVLEGLLEDSSSSPHYLLLISKEGSPCHSFPDQQAWIDFLEPRVGEHFSISHFGGYNTALPFELSAVVEDTEVADENILLSIAECEKLFLELGLPSRGAVLGVKEGIFRSLMTSWKGRIVGGSSLGLGVLATLFFGIHLLTGLGFWMIPIAFGFALVGFSFTFVPHGVSKFLVWLLKNTTLATNINGNATKYKRSSQRIVLTVLDHTIGLENIEAQINGYKKTGSSFSGFLRGGLVGSGLSIAEMFLGKRTGTIAKENFKPHSITHSAGQ